MSPSKGPRLRVVVDGSNLATEGRSTPSLTQLDQAVQAFTEEHPTAEVIVVADAVAGTPRQYGDQVIEHCLRLLATMASTEEMMKAWSVAV